MNALPTTKPRMRKPASPTALRFIVRDSLPTYGETPCLDAPEKIYSFFKDVMATDENFEPNKEHVWVIVLNARLRVIGYNVVSVGTVNESSCHPREVLRPVIMAGGSSYIVLHNHPAGDPSPSRADETVTRLLVECSELMQVRMLDHVICGIPAPGRTGYYSFREAGLIP